MAFTAREPSHRIDVRFTKTYSTSQKTAMSVRTPGL